MREAEDEAVDDARAGAEDYDRARDYEHLGRRAGYEALALELQSGGDHGVCKAGDGHQSARSAELRSVVIYAEAVQSAPRNTSVMEQAVPASARERPEMTQSSVITWPRAQMAPPMRKARSRSPQSGEVGDLRFTYSAYCWFVISGIKSTPEHILPQTRRIIYALTAGAKLV